jgi:hypothetical protein
MCVHHVLSLYNRNTSFVLYVFEEEEEHQE